MRLALLGLLIVFSMSAHASDMQLVLFEEATKNTTYHSLNPETGKAVSATDATGTSLNVTSTYRISNYKLEATSGGPPLMEATEILTQTTSDGLDVLVIRDEYNSFSNPVRWLSALAGHPVQVSKILWVVIKDGAVLHRIELQREPNSYRWNASLFRQPTTAPEQ